jgi:hypothetical protein
MRIHIMKLEEALLLLDGLAGRTDVLAGGTQIISGLSPDRDKIVITIGIGSDVVVSSERAG